MSDVALEVGVQAASRPRRRIRPANVLLAPVVAWVSYQAATVGGFKLVPDTAIYARRGFHIWPSPLGDLAGTFGGYHLVVLVSAGACAACVLLVRRPIVLALICGFWMLFPGVDALGSLFVILLVQRRRDRYWFLALAAHPVAAIVTTPLAFGLTRRTVLLACACTALTIVAVGIYGGGFSTTDRYLMPLIVGVLA